MSNFIRYNPASEVGKKVGKDRGYGTTAAHVERSDGRNTHERWTAL
jgi:hypothetical protein